MSVREASTSGVLVDPPETAPQAIAIPIEPIGHVDAAPAPETVILHPTTSTTTSTTDGKEAPMDGKGGGLMEAGKVEGVGGSASDCGRGLGLDTVWSMIQATGVDKRLYEQVRLIVGQLAQRGDDEKLSRVTFQLQAIAAELKSVESDVRACQATLQTHSTHLAKTEAESYKQRRVAEGLSIIRKSHYACICTKSKTPACFRLFLDCCFE